MLFARARREPPSGPAPQQPTLKLRLSDWILGQGAPQRAAAITLAAAILLGGALLAAIAANEWRDRVEADRHAQFAREATRVSSEVGALLRRDTDFVVAMGAAMRGELDERGASFGRLYRELEGEQRLVGTIGTAFVRAVPRSDVAAFIAQRSANPNFQAISGAARAATALPAAGAPTACLAQYAELGRIPVQAGVASAVLGDWCSPRNAWLASLTAASERSSGLVALPFSLGHNLHAVALTLDVGAHPTRDAPRVATAARAWITTTFDADAILAQAIGKRGELAVALDHSNRGEAPLQIAAAGSAPAGSQVVRSTISAGGAWKLAVAGSVVGPGPSPQLQGFIVFGVGLLISALLAGVAYSLCRAWSSAARVASERTAELQHREQYDVLTELPNRHMFDLAVRRTPPPARGGNAGSVAVFCIELCDFFKVNDTFGHEVGRELVRRVARRLSAAFRDADLVARLDTAEFGLLIERPDVDSRLSQIAARVLDAVQGVYQLDLVTEPLEVLACVGAASAASSSPQDLIEDAEIALHAALNGGRGNTTVYRAYLRTTASDRHRLEMELRRAVENEEIILHYQPIVALHSERPVGVEALARWVHGSRGAVPPDEFIPLAEATGVIEDITRWVLKVACRQVAQWREEGLDLFLAVNIAASQLGSDGLVNDVRDAIGESGLPFAKLTLEITETGIMRNRADTATRLAALKRLGVSLAIDDFGTGHSSLSYLRQIPADLLKIDRSFVADMTRSPRSMALMRTVAELGTALGLGVLAEGIEDEDQLEALRKHGVELGQGYLFARPGDATSVRPLLGGGLDQPPALADGAIFEDPDGAITSSHGPVEPVVRRLAAIPAPESA